MWPVPALVARVDHRGQRGALAGAGGAHHQQQAALFHDQFGQDGGQAQLPSGGTSVLMKRITAA
jgi:hypothetical protein